MPRPFDYGRYYRKWHSDDAGHLRKMLRYHSRMLGPYLPSDRNARILEIGCGMGYTLTLLQEMGYTRAEGIDIDPGQTKACETKKLNVTLVNDSEAFLRERPESYEIIIALDVLEHGPVYRAEAFASAIFDSLKKNGRLIATVPNASSGLAFRWRYNDWTHRTSFTEHSLDFLLYHAGFDDIEVFEAGPFRRPRLPFLVRPSVIRWLLLLFARSFRRLEMISELGWKEGRRVPLSLNIMAIAEKRRE